MKRKVLFACWLIGVVLILVSSDYNLYAAFKMLEGAVIGAGAVVFLLDYIESR